MNISGILKSNYGVTNQMNSLKAAINKSDEKLSTGKRINSAADSPIDMILITKRNSEISSARVAQENIKDALILTDTIDKSLSSAQEIGEKLKELSVRYNSDTISREDKAIIESQAKSLTEELGHVLKNTKHNGISLFEQKSISVQTGENPNDKYSIKLPELSRTEKTTTEHKTEVVSKKYSMEINTPGNFKINGEFTLDFKASQNQHDFTINDNGVEKKGSLSFDCSGRGRFEIEWTKGIKLTGTLNLGGQASESDLSGTSTYRMDILSGGFSSNVKFSLKSEEVKTEKVESEKTISLLDVGNEKIEDVLKGDFIEKNILNPLSFARTSAGIASTVLEGRLSQQIIKEDQSSKALSRIEDLDMAKEIMKKTKAEMLLNANISLFSESIERDSNLIYRLLS